MPSSWLQIYHRTELLLHQKFLEIAFGAKLDLFENISLDGTILPEEVSDASRMQALYEAFFPTRFTRESWQSLQSLDADDA